MILFGNALKKNRAPGLPSSNLGRFESAFPFDGVNDNASSSLLGITKYNFGTSAFSINCWINLTILPAINNGTIFSIYKDTGGGTFKLIRCLVDTNGKMSFYIQDSASNVGNFTSPINTFSSANINKWVHVAFQRVNSSHLASSYEIYLNGILQTLTTVTLIGSNPNFNNFDVSIAGLLGIGYYPFSPGIWFFPGFIQDVQIYNNFLSSTEIAGIVNTAFTVPSAKSAYLVGRYEQLATNILTDIATAPLNLPITR